MSNLSETPELHELVTRLRSSKPTAKPMPTTFKAQLRTRLLASQTTSKNAWFPAFLTAASHLSLIGLVAAFVFSMVYFTPVGQIIADALVQLGPYVLTHKPSAAEQSIATPQDVGQRVETKTVTLTEAGKMTNFTVLYPRFLPEDYPQKEVPEVVLEYNQQNRISAVEMMLFSEADQKILYYTQIPYTPNSEVDLFELGIGNASAVPITVGDSEGIWLENFNWGVKEGNTLIPYNVLIWQSTLPNGETFLFWLGSEAHLSRKEMLHIAESLSPVGDIGASQ